MSTQGTRKLRFLLLCVIVGLTILFMNGCSTSSSSRSSSSSYRYGTKESYDAKYGAGSYDADKALMDSMRDAWNSGN